MRHKCAVTLNLQDISRSNHCAPILESLIIRRELQNGDFRHRKKTEKKSYGKLTRVKITRKRAITMPHR